MKDANSQYFSLHKKSDQVIIRRIKKNIRRKRDPLPRYKKRESVGVFSIQSFSVLFKRERVKNERKRRFWTRTRRKRRRREEDSSIGKREDEEEKMKTRTTLEEKEALRDV